MTEEQPNTDARPPAERPKQIRWLLARTGILFAIGWSLLSALLNIVGTLKSASQHPAASAYASAATQSLLVFVVSIWVLTHLGSEGGPTWRQMWSWFREKARS